MEEPRILRDGQETKSGGLPLVLIVSGTLGFHSFMVRHAYGSPGPVCLNAGKPTRSNPLMDEKRWAGKRCRCPAVGAANRLPAAGHNLVPCSHTLCTRNGRGHANVLCARNGRGHTRALCARNGRGHNPSNDYGRHGRGPAPRPYCRSLGLKQAPS